MSGCSWLDDLDLEASMADCAASIQHDVVQSAAADQHLSSLQELLGPCTGDDHWLMEPPPPVPQQPAMPHWPPAQPPPLMAAGHPNALAQQQPGLVEQQLLQNIVYARSPDSLLAATTSYMELLQGQQAAASHNNGAAGVVAAQPEPVPLQPGGQQELYAALTAALEAAELLPAVALQDTGDVSAAPVPAAGSALAADRAGWDSNQFAWPAAAPPSMPAAWAADAAVAAHAGLGGCAPLLRHHSAMAALGNDGGAAAEGAGSSCSSTNDHNSTWGMTPVPVLLRALSEPLCTTAVAGNPVAELGLTSAAALQAQQQLPVALAELRQPQLKPHLKFRGTPAAAAGCQTQEGPAQAPGTLRVNIKCFKPAANRPPPPPPEPAMPELDAAGREQRRRLQHKARLRHYAKLLKLLDARLKPAAKAKTKAKAKPVYC